MAQLMEIEGSMLVSSYSSDLLHIHTHVRAGKSTVSQDVPESRLEQKFESRCVHGF